MGNSGPGEEISNDAFSDKVNRDTLKSPSQDLQRRKSTRKSRITQDNTLFEFFKSLDYRPGVDNSGTVRASYKAGRASYNLFAIPG